MFYMYSVQEKVYSNVVHRMLPWQTYYTLRMAHFMVYYCIIYFA